MSGGDFLSRWSRRKREVEAVEAPAQEPLAPEPEAPPSELSEEEIALLPSLDSLTAETDLGQFLRAGVPALLRNAALRRMWSLDPSIRDYLCEAREYAYDWNVGGGVPGQGPMLASDDVESMLRDIFEGTPEPAPPTETADSQAEPEAKPDSSAEAILEPPALPPPAVEAASPPHPAGVPAPAPVAQARMRRHGGAIPL